jgi:hypothetical protein
MAESARRKLEKAERIAQLTEYLEQVALNLPDDNGERPEAEIALRISAADKAMDRLDGKPQQTNKNLNVTVLDGLTADQQRAVIQVLDALAGDEGGASEGDAETHR